MMLAVILLILVVLPIFLYTQNNMLQVTDINVASDKLPDEFVGYKILQISDLHSKEFGSNQKKIMDKIIQINPDVIVVTGDTVDSRRYDEDVCIELLEQLAGRVPVYLVTGNHEARSNRFETFENRLQDVGVKVLRNEGTLLERKGSTIAILGVDDPAMQGQEQLETALKQLASEYRNQYKYYYLIDQSSLICIVKIIWNWYSLVMPMAGK